MLNIECKNSCFLNIFVDYLAQKNSIDVDICL